MRIAYFDCFSGISGDMTIAAFLDAGLEMSALERGLSKLKIKGYELKKSKTRRGGLAGTKFDCVVKGKAPRNHRSLKEIIGIIEKSSLGSAVKARAKDIFTRIGEAEARIHGIDRKSDIRFHELGDIDSIVDIVGVAIAVDELGIDELYASSVNTGRTFVDSEHGRLPVPAPASLELLRGIPMRISGLEVELVTPTGAGILRSLCKGFGEMPQMEIEKIGYGAGSREFAEFPNMLRVIIGQAKEAFLEDRIFVIETNIDDMSPQSFEYLFERLFKEGALDVYTTNIQMKKSRPAFKLTALARHHDLNRVASAIFGETTSIGIRFYEAGRFKLDRKFKEVRTKYGEVKVKVAGLPGSRAFTVSPEYEDCAKLARERNIPFKTIYEEAKRLVNV